MITTEIKNRFENLIIYMLTSDVLSPYANILARCNIYEEQKVPTIGVRLVGKSIEILYNNKFIKSLSNKQLIFILIHEMYHVMLHHQTREINASSHIMANKVEDAIINDSIIEDHFTKPYYELPMDEMGNFSGVTTELLEQETGHDYKGMKMFEAMYLWYKQYNKEEPGDNNNSGNNPDNDNGPVIISQVGFDTHLQNQCTPEEAQIISKELESELKSRGVMPGGLTQALKKIEKRPDYLKIIKKVISNHLLHGIKKKTFSRPHIYGIEGLKGNIYRQFQINCILDTSGSMSNEIEFVLSFLYKNKVVVTLIQIDTEIQSVQTFKNTKAIVDTSIKGYGGTILQPALDYVAKDKNLRKYCNLILTDGWTDDLNFKDINRPTLILSTDTKCHVKNDNNRVKQIIIKP